MHFTLLTDCDGQSGALHVVNAGAKLRLILDTTQPRALRHMGHGHETDAPAPPGGLPPTAPRVAADSVHRSIVIIQYGEVS